MAQNKYDLLVQKANEHKRIKQQPWFKERLLTKYRKSALKKGPVLNPTLRTSTWVFVKDGIDDFRADAQNESQNDYFYKMEKGNNFPLVFKNSKDQTKAKPSERKKCLSTLSREEKVYQKALPRQQRHRDKIKALEENFLKHPLALYSHLEDSVPPELFDEIVDVLDPAMNLSDYPHDDIEAPSNESQHSIITKDCNIKDLPNKLDVNHPYTLQSIQSEGPISVERSKAAKMREAANIAQEKEIKEVTTEFCKWIRDLGGEENNIEESTINSLFASGYETKPTLSIPIRVVELTNIPPELRSENTATPTEVDQDQQTDEEGESYKPSWVKIKYGAWYLNPKTWKSRPANKPLEDPKLTQNQHDSSSRIKSKELDKVLATLHGTKAFKGFVDQKGSRDPEFLKSVTCKCDEPSEHSSENNLINDKQLQQRARSLTAGSMQSSR